MTQTALMHPALRDCRRLFLRNYEVRIRIGVHDFEKKGEQRVLINVEMFVPLAQSTPQADELHEVAADETAAADDENVVECHGMLRPCWARRQPPGSSSGFSTARVRGAMTPMRSFSETSV